MWFSFSRSCQRGCVWLNERRRMCHCVCVCACECKAVRPTHYIKTHSSLCGTAGHCWNRTPVSLPILLKLLSCKRLPRLVTPGREREEMRKTERMCCSLQHQIGIGVWRPLNQSFFFCTFYLSCSTSICPSFSLAAHILTFHTPHPYSNIIKSLVSSVLQTWRAM